MLESAWVAVGFVLYLTIFLGGWHTRFRWYLLPCLPWLGRSWYLLAPTRELRFFSPMMEGLRGFDGVKSLSSTPLLLQLFVLSTLGPLFNANNLTEALNALTFTFAVTCSLGYLTIFKRDLEVDVPIADHMLLMFTLLAWFYKVAYGYQLGIGPLLVRGGGVYASNQYISIALCLLPFARQRWLVLGVITTIVLQFSRGGYLALGVLLFSTAVSSRVTGQRSVLSEVARPRNALILLLLLAAGPVLLSLVAPDAFKFLLIRMVGGGAYGINISLAESLSSLPLTDLVDLATASAEGDDRTLIWAAAFKIAEINSYVGVGVGNFESAVTTIDKALRYSNAHNMYLTLLSELGLGGCVVFVASLVMYGVRAFAHNAAAFSALVTFAFYGLFSGQIYETAAEVSITQFVVLLFVFANVDMSARQLVSPCVRSELAEGRV